MALALGNFLSGDVAVREALETVPL